MHWLGMVNEIILMVGTFRSIKAPDRYLEVSEIHACLSHFTFCCFTVKLLMLQFEYYDH